MHVSHPRHIYRGFTASIPGGAPLFTWAMEGAVPLGATLRVPDTSPVVPEEVRLRATSIEAVDPDKVSVPLAVGLSLPLGLFGSEG
jgi:hypothetical protein